MADPAPLLNSPEGTSPVEDAPPPRPAMAPLTSTAGSAGTPADAAAAPDVIDDGIGPLAVNADGLLSMAGTLAEANEATIVEPPTPVADPGAPLLTATPTPQPQRSMPQLHTSRIVERRERELGGDFRKGGSLLWHAINDGNAQAVDALLEGGYDVNLRAINSESPLHVAIRLGNAPLALKLLERGADPGQNGPCGYAALQYCAHYDRPDIASVLIQRGVDLEAANFTSGHSALFVAAKSNATNVLGLLIQHGARTDRHFHVGLTAAHEAASRNHTEAIALLLEANVDMNTVNRDGYSPLHLAAQSGATEAAAMLARAPAVNPTQKMGVLSWVGRGWGAVDLAKRANKHETARVITECIEERTTRRAESPAGP
mmetsp:Transcript_35105/g.105885  ORF Transcript_35105/g.105885 Transcript_35105/m.105885 type:complete len:373 (+) Transcript_35105:103-1221(+)